MENQQKIAHIGCFPFPPLIQIIAGALVQRSSASTVRPSSSSANSLPPRLRYLSVLTGMFIKMDPGSPYGMGLINMTVPAE